MSEIPIIVGVGDFVNRSTSLADGHEPLTLILNAISLALKDTDLPDHKRQQLQSAIDSIDVVRTWTWPYDDLPGDIGRGLGVDARHRFYSDHGGNKPAKLFDQAARRISRGETKVAVVTGGEALASLSAFAAARKLPPPGWTKTTEGVESVFSPTGRDLGKDIGAVHSIGAPIHVYPLFENGFRAHRRQSIAKNHDESAQLYAEFARVAEKNPYAWNYGKPAATKDVIATVSKKNRMICFPCTSPRACALW
jgi:acetyl-CoA acetyltransferase